MAFKVVTSFLGGSILPQTMRSDFAQVLAVVKEARETNGDPLTEDERGLTGFTEGLTHIFSGDFSAAETVLEGLQASVEEKVLAGIWPARLALLEALKICHQRFPPLLAFWKCLDGVTCILQDPLNDFKQALVCLHEKMAAHQPSFAPADDLEFNALYNLLTLPLLTWNNAIPFHNASPRFMFPTSEHMTKMKETLHNNASNRKIFEDWAQKLDNSALERDLKLVNLQLELASDAPSWRGLLQSLKENASLHNDYITIGYLDMTLADKLVSPMFTSPLALNLIAMESTDVGVSNHHWDPVEHTICLESSPEVDELYSKALEAFIEAKAPRGRGAVLMRQACLIYGVHCDSQLLPGSEVLESARNKLNEAIQHLGIDFTQVQIAKCHLTILDILQGNDESAVSCAGSIGQRCTEVQNFNVGRFIGILLLRFGRRQLDLHSRLDIALLSYRCAEACFTSLGITSLILKALFSQSQALDNVVNAGGALDVLHRHQPLFRTLIDELDKKRTVEAKKHESITCLQINLFTTYSGLVSRILLRANHPAQMRQWDEEVKDWMARPEVIAQRDQVITNKNITDFALEGVPEEERSLLWKKADYERMWLRKYAVAFNRHRRAREAMDLDQAVTELRIYIDSLDDSGESSLPLKMGIMACSDTGDTSRAQDLLRKIPYEKLFDRTIRTPYHGPELWVRLVDGRHFVRPDDVEVALHSCIMACDWETGQRVVKEITSLVPTFLSPSEKIVDRDMAFRLTHAAILAMNCSDDQTAFSLLLEVIKYIETGRNSTQDAESRRGSLSNATMAAIPVLMAALCERNSRKGIPIPILNEHFDFQPQSWLEASVVFEEQGKARQLRDLLGQSKLPIRSEPGSGYSDHDLLIQLRRLPQSELTKEEFEEIEALESKESASDEQINQAHKLPNYKSPALKLSDLSATLSPKVLVLSMSFSRYSSMLFAIDNGGVRKVCPIALTDLKIQRLAISIVNAISCPDSTKREASWKKLQNEVLELSKHIIAPVENLVDEATHIIFVPGQPLTSFPFQVLTHRGAALFMSKSTSMAPSLATLQYLYRRQKPIDPLISVVCKPSTPMEFSRTNETLIPMASIEAISIARLFGTWPQMSSQVDRKAFKTTLERNAVVHVGTHGRRHPISPWLAHLSLKEKLYVLDLSKMRNTAALVVFSACLSGRGYATLGNDELGFATAVLASGCQCYVGALWEIDDVATLLLMTAFYTHMATTPKISVAEMLRLAQCEVFRMTRETATTRIGEIMQTMDEASLAGMRLNDLVRRPKSVLKRQMENLPHSFAHPFYWAGFMPVGNALLRMTQSGD